MIYLISDTHFGHKSIVEAGHRPAGFEEKIFKNVAKLGPNDILLDLGDVAFSDPQYWVTRYRTVCQAKMWLVRGNHDNKSIQWFLDYGFDFVADSISLNIFGYEVHFSHAPEDLAQVRYDFNVHGHMHSGTHHSEEFELSHRHRLIAIEGHFKPIPFTKKFLEGR